MTLSDLGPYPDTPGYDEAVARDEADPLQRHRDRFLHTDLDLIYLDGNSLGRLPVDAAKTMERVTQQWGDRLIRAWNEGWWDLQLHLGDKLAPVIGAGPGEVILSDSTSVNLYKLALAALTAAPESRKRIVTDDLNFPSDVYILDAVATQGGGSLEIVESDGVNGPVDGLGAAVDDRTALVSLSHTVFQSGYTYDLTGVTNMAHEAGARVLWDCSHSVGSVPIDLSGADLAIGCTYKHLNGGPGAPAFLYVREDLQDTILNPIPGWWSHTKPFALDLAYEPVSGIRRFHTGTMPILSLATVEAGIDEVVDAGIGAIREKSVGIVGYLIDQFTEHLEPRGFELASPADPERRGAHISLRHEMAWPINVALIERAKVIPDFRAPDTIRLGPAPLYTSFIDIHTAVQRMRAIVDGHVYEDFVGATATVT